MASMSLAPYPPVNIRERIVPDEWAFCLDSWLLLIQRLLSLPSEVFSAPVQYQPAIPFVVSYMKNNPSNNDSMALTAKDSSLRKQCFLLTHRMLSDIRPLPNQLLEFAFLADFSKTYSKSLKPNQLLDLVWGEHKLEGNISMIKSKAHLTELLETENFDSSLNEQISKVGALAKACYSYAQFLMIGSDFIDALSAALSRQPNAAFRRKLTALIHICLTSLMNPKRPQTTSLLDHLYDLRTTPTPKLLVQSTPFLRKLEKYLTDKDADAKRARPLLDSYAVYKPSTNGKGKRFIRRKIKKEKSKAPGVDVDSAPTTVHAHRISLVSQIHDLFPDLGSGFIIKLLHEYGDDAEKVTAHLLEDSLPPYLKFADRTESASDNSLPGDAVSPKIVSNLAPRSTPPLMPTRRNVYDDDDFDRLIVDNSKLHFGRKNANLTADDLLATKKAPSHKAAILSALAAFDSDDDERDDTYDVADVGGTVDTTFADPDADLGHDKNEEALFTAYKANQDVFQRDAETRRGKQRLSLKAETGMTDEAIEGWAIMLSRDPRRLQRLERTHEMNGVVQQPALSGTSWKTEPGLESTEDSDFGGNGEASRGAGRGRGRGRRGGSGRSANVAGPSDDRGTQITRQRKDANKGSRANHNRRDQRARKMARAGGIVG